MMRAASSGDGGRARALRRVGPSRGAAQARCLQRDFERFRAVHVAAARDGANAAAGVRYGAHAASRAARDGLPAERCRRRRIPGAALARRQSRRVRPADAWRRAIGRALERSSASPSDAADRRASGVRVSCEARRMSRSCSAPPSTTRADVCSRRRARVSRRRSRCVCGVATVEGAAAVDSARARRRAPRTRSRRERHRAPDRGRARARDRTLRARTTVADRPAAAHRAARRPSHAVRADGGVVLDAALRVRPRACGVLKLVFA